MSIVVDPKPLDLAEHHLMALRYLSTTPDRITTINDEPTLAAAMIYMQLEKIGLVSVDNEDGMLVTITQAGLRVLSDGVFHGPIHD